MVSASKDNLDYYLSQPYKTERLNVRSVKVYGDGALGSRGAAIENHIPIYLDILGLWLLQLLILKLGRTYCTTDFQMNTHAIGDSANVVILRAYQKALEGKKNRRWKVEHAQIISSGGF